MKFTLKNIHSKIIFSVAISALLVACKSTPMNDKPAAAVEDKSPTTTSSPVVTPPPPDTNAIKEVAIDSDTNKAEANNPLKDPNNILSKRSIYFDYNSDVIRAEFRPNLEAHAKYLKEHADAKMVLQGNSDERGTREYNLSLGQRRSVAVKKALNQLGAQDAQIETVSYGKEKATPNCKDEDCYQKDRRVDVVYGSD